VVESSVVRYGKVKGRDIFSAMQSYFITFVAK